MNKIDHNNLHTKPTDLVAVAHNNIFITQMIECVHTHTHTYDSIHQHHIQHIYYFFPSSLIKWVYIKKIIMRRRRIHCRRREENEKAIIIGTNFKVIGFWWSWKCQRALKLNNLDCTNQITIFLRGVQVLSHSIRKFFFSFLIDGSVLVRLIFK